MKMTKTFVLFFVFTFTSSIPTLCPAQSKVVFTVRDYGAKGDGKTIDSRGINKAIEAASENGGGTVYFPAGEYLSGSIRVKSDITLYLENGSTIIECARNWV